MTDETHERIADLLKALIRARDRLANMAISGGGGAQNKAIGLEEIDAAIAKAEGRSK